MTKAYETIIVGGGFAGLTAARELSMLGHQVLVLEARDRLGGRTWTDRRFGMNLEMGGTFVHWYQPHVWTEITRYGLEVIPVPKADKAYWITDGTLRSGTVGQFHTILKKSAESLMRDSKEKISFPYKPFESKSLKKLDGKSVANYIDNLDLSNEERDALWALLATDASSYLEEVSLMQMFRWVGFANGNTDAFFDTVSGYKLKTGTGSLIAHIASDIAGDIQLETEVVSIEQMNNKIVATTKNGQSYEANTAIVTVPLNVLNNIQFRPSLSESKKSAMREGQASKGVKVFARVRGELESFIAYAPAGYPLNVVRTENIGEGESIVLGFGSDANTFDANDRLAVQGALRHWLTDIEVIESTSHDWVAEKFSRGTWPMMRPNQFTSYLEELKRHEKNVYFAGSIYANGWNSFIDGAIETGITTARKVHENLLDRA